MKNVTDMSIRADPFRPAWELWPGGMEIGGDGFRPFVEIYSHPRGGVRGLVLVVPGGGYRRLRDAMVIEGHDVALALNRLGFHAAVLKYRQHPNVFPAPQRDLCRAVKILRGLTAELALDPGKLAVAGFSAGGHLAACAAVMATRFDLSAGDRFDALPARPDAALLGYAALDRSMEDIDILAGDCQELKARDALTGRVTADTSPCFLHHAVDDPVIPVAYSLAFAAALEKAGVSCVLHVLESGGHAYGAGDAKPSTAIWLELAATWLRTKGF